MPASGAALAATPGKVVPPLTMCPSSRIMGSVEERYVGSNSYYYSFGSKLQSDWSGIDDKKNR